ncbi:M20 metallopeptidase family protein [Acetohalobium arabaticum]|uniref:Amidohydrolase n=1 Tax=Acetohalobium arabaticum (strain ATCC 49924 / DSM 5501 / Z-7288) TaxID=574087 RepID=D9QQW4_ACEAZ|nr:M20 family metallopeptidase [Acetohalobium arabaticum]ADL12905.1 amidohydrolase [Acetohalobium arabaticum DSM 5501]
MKLENQLKKEVQKVSNRVVEWRRDFHRHPELAFQEERTSRKVRELLTSWGIKTETVAQTGIIGLLEGSNRGKTVAIRADIDALPITEETNLPYRSQEEGKMHACGHDAHTAIALGVAKVLTKFKDSLDGNIKFIFQPAEEGAGGAKPMIEAGALDKPPVEAIFGFHVWPDLPSGKIGLKKGPIMASADDLKLTIKGQGAHGARPHQGRDPITIGADTIVALQQLVSREVEARQPTVLSIGSFQAGSTYNVIPDKAVIKGTLRTLNPEVRSYIKERMTEVIDSLTQALQADYELEYNCQLPPTVNTPGYIEVLKEVAEEVSPGSSIVLNEASMGSEDFGYFLQEVPGAYFMLGTRNPDQGVVHPIHSSKFDLDEAVLPLGVEILCHSVLKSLIN